MFTYNNSRSTRLCNSRYAIAIQGYAIAGDANLNWQLRGQRGAWISRSADREQHLELTSP